MSERSVDAFSDIISETEEENVGLKSDEVLKPPIVSHHHRGRHGMNGNYRRDHNPKANPLPRRASTWSLGMLLVNYPICICKILLH